MGKEHPPRPTAARPPRPRRAWQVFRTLVGGAGGFSPPPNPLRCTHIRSSDHPAPVYRLACEYNCQLATESDERPVNQNPHASILIRAAHYMLYSILYLEPARTRHLLYLYAAVGVRTAVYLPCHGLAWRVGAQQSTHSTETRHRSKGSRGTIDRGHKELRRLRPCAALKSRAQLESRLVSQFTHTTGHVGSLSL